MLEPVPNAGFKEQLFSNKILNFFSRNACPTLKIIVLLKRYEGLMRGTLLDWLFVLFFSDILALINKNTFTMYFLGT